ncbi:sulfotransferase domain-containing protein [Pleurocapsales cyanobacterium LEGE 10410]|nr:sulfotransferase domain-containing protein [Pleurocapsales cyanobacterium LEGE 10410]
MNLKTPDFIIIGAAKSGTTSLYEYLCRHPQIFMCTPKEPDFFSIDANYAKGMDWYCSLFDEASPTQTCGEASTTYSRWHQHPQTAERIYQALGQIKLIYIMRHPVDRAYSFYIHRFKGSLHKPELAVSNTFEETINQQSEFIESSYYLQQIEQYLQFFPQESLLFLLMEDLIDRPAETLNKIMTFISVDNQVDLIEQEKIVANQAGDYPEWYVKKQLLTPLKAIPGVNTLTSLLPEKMKNNVYQIIKKAKYKEWKNSQFTPPPMLPETRTMLLEHFREPNLKLARFLDRDLSHWNK